MKKTIIFLFLFSFLIAQVIPLNASMIFSGISTSHEPDPATIKTAIAEFKNLSKKERKQRVNEAKKELKYLKKEKKEESSSKVNKTLLIVLAILLPPLGIYLYEDKITTKFWICLGLSLFFLIPGSIYAVLTVTGSL